jgi:hypothetical protein
VQLPARWLLLPSCADPGGLCWLPLPQERARAEGLQRQLQAMLREQAEEQQEARQQQLQQQQLHHHLLLQAQQQHLQQQHLQQQQHQQPTTHPPAGMQRAAAGPPPAPPFRPGLDRQQPAGLTELAAALAALGH